MARRLVTLLIDVTYLYTYNVITIFKVDAFGNCDQYQLSVWNS